VKILIVGATGVFGTRLARHLAAHSEFELVLTSRNAARAEALARSLPRATGIGFDHGHAPQETLARIAPWAVVDCSGPFQSANYGLAKAALLAGAHFVDLADAWEYLSGFEDALDSTARAQSRSALAGASSTPALSGAVVRDLTQGWQQVETVDFAITPGGKSEVGRAVIAAVLSYVGRDIPSFENGQEVAVTGWGSAKTREIPGLGRRFVSPVETYDYCNLSNLVTGRISFAAGLESRLEHYGMVAIANLRKRGLLPDPTRFIDLFLAARRFTRLFTSDVGAMDVKITGIDAERQERTARWVLIARDDHGPWVPVMACAAALRHLAKEKPKPGAGVAELPLALIEAEMRHYEIAISQY